MNISKDNVSNEISDLLSRYMFMPCVSEPRY